MHTRPGAGTDVWASPEFRAQATAWVAAVCREHGLEPTGEVEQPHNRPWSSTIRFETDGGALWFKVNGAGTRHEPALLGVLATLAPSLAPVVLAVDDDRGWSLMHDAGPVLRLTAAADRLWDQWAALLPRYAAVQLELAGHVAELRATGLEDTSPCSLPQHAEELLHELGAGAPDKGGLTPEEVEAVARRLPAYAEWCTELDAGGVPASIQHDDLHSANVCWPGGPDDATQARIIDWGDASVGHPFGTMLGTLNSIAYHADVQLDDPRVLRVRDAYLEAFTAYAHRDALVRQVELARRTGPVSRALSYRAALTGAPVVTHADLDFPVRSWFLEILED